MNAYIRTDAVSQGCGERNELGAKDAPDRKAVVLIVVIHVRIRAIEVQVVRF